MKIRGLVLAGFAATAAGSPISQDLLQPSPLVTTYGDPNSALYLASGGPRYDGVAQLIIESSDGLLGCTGALLPGGTRILTAAHCLSDAMGHPDVSSLLAMFHLSGGRPPEVIGSTEVVVYPGFTGDLRQGNDLGLVVLKRPASAAVPRYEIYTGRDEIGGEYEIAGFGAAGRGQIEPIDDGQRRRGWNTFDSTMAGTFGEFPGWTGGQGVLISDFDNGLAANDALGLFYGIRGLGLGPREASMAPSDSGGPAFIDGRVAGLASFRLRLQFTDGVSSDVDDISNASFGEFNAFTRVSGFSSWIQPVPEPDTSVLCLIAFAAAICRYLWRRYRQSRLRYHQATSLVCLKED
jgi:hypothetical protein